MNFLMIFKVAMRSLRRALLRSSLTMLGIIIGVATVITMVGIGNGAKDRMSNLLSGVDSNRLYLYAMMATDWRGWNTQAKPGDGITLEDYQAIRERVKGITSISLEVWGRLDQVFSNGRTSHPQVEGIDVDGLSMQKREIVAGTFFSRQDEREVTSVCVITQSLAKDLYDSQDPVGRILRINQMPFLVIGVMSDDNSMGGRRSQKDLMVFLPYTDVLRRLDRTAEIQVEIKAATPEQLHTIQQDVGDLMEERRGRRKAEFVTTDISDIIKSYVSGVETMTLLLASIAGISLLVGGIGIMNIMLVSVTERTREIGIRLAIGTLERDILRQFIFEAAILSVLGGIVGIGLGIGATVIMTQVYQWKTHLTLGSILGAFLTSGLVGIFFGWYPARKAARLDPIEALRYE